MDAVVMAGGRGARLDTAVEKPLYRVGGVPMVDRVLDALAAAETVDRRLVACSPHTPETRAHADVQTVDTPGDGYVADLSVALDAVETPALTVAADLPVLSGVATDRALSRYQQGSLAVEVPVSLKRRLGVSLDTTTPDGERAPTGLNVVGGGPEETVLCQDRRLAINVNHRRDARVAEVWL